MRLIDPEDAIRGIVIESVSDNDEAIKATAKAIVVIQNTPTIVEFEGDINKVIVKGEEYHRIVRCKDCKWFGKVGCAIKIVDESDKPEENDYCSFGERKSNETD